MTKDDIIKQALKALDKLSKLGNGNQDGNSLGNTIAQEAREHLFTALEQPEQEPSQWRDMVVVNLVREGINKHKARDLADHFATTPPAAQRPWVGLTDEEIKTTLSQLYCDINQMKLAPADRPQKETVGFLSARAIEAKLKEKNNA